MPTFFSRVVSGMIAFRKAYMAAVLEADEDFADYDARRLRYSVLWSFFEHTAYDSIVHSWSTAYKLKYSLYKHIRSIYNPAYRLGAFWQSHLLGGALDPDAGDGLTVPSAIPIDVQAGNETAIRDGIAQLWQWSNFQELKDVITLYGAVLGDVGIKVVDDTELEKVYFQVVYPGTIKELDKDPYGNVKGYVLEEERTHPKNDNKVVTYMETAERLGALVLYKTYLNGDLYAWDDQGPEWEMPYGFVPFVAIQHNNVGLDWGWSELHPARTRFHELDDLASATSDQIRKTVNVAWFFAGLAKPVSPLTLSPGPDATTARPEPQRENIPAIYSPKEHSKPYPLIADVNLEHTAMYLDRLVGRLEEDYPELRYERLRGVSNVAADTLREARKPVEEKVGSRRATYDDAMARLFQMGLSIAGDRGLIEGITLASYEQGELDLSIGNRDVFIKSPEEDIETSKQFWLAAKEAVTSGVPLPAFLELEGWSEERIAIVTESEEYKEQQDMKKQMAMGFGMQGEEDQEGEEGEEGEE